MRKAEKDEIVLLNIERHPLLLVAVMALSAAILYLAAVLLKDVNPLGFLVLIPGSLLAFYSLWLLLNPFALIFDNKFEIKYSFLHHKSRYYVDIKKVTQSKGKGLFITYNDDEVERISLFGIRRSHIHLLKEQVEKMVTESLKTR